MSNSPDPAPNRMSEPLDQRAFRWVLFAGLLIMVAANAPGHLSYDSVVQLFEGRHGVRQTWAPPLQSWLMGIFDEIVPGTGLYIAAIGLVLTAALASMVRLRDRASWAAIILAGAMVLSPMVLVWQGVVWKDIAYANLAIAAFVCLAHAARHWGLRSRTLLPLAGALILFACAAQMRQNGLVAVLVGAMALGWTARGEGWRRALGWGVGGLVAVMVLSSLIGIIAQPKGSSSSEDGRRGLRVVQHYDIVGSLAHDPDLDLAIIGKASPRALEVIRTEGLRVYSPDRVDYFAQSKALGKVLWPLPDKVVSAQWRDIILHHPGAYLAHRFDVFRWVFAQPEIELCLPVFVGVSGREDMLKDLKIPAGVEPQDQVLANYATWFYYTPVYSHLAYALVALLVGVVLLTRRDAPDMVMVGLMASSLGFSASFFIISVACDYRYLYVQDLTAMAGVLYLALDPPMAQLRALVARLRQRG